MKPQMVIRRDAVQACIDRFDGKPLKWGRVDCGRIVSHNLRQLGIATSLVKGLTYSTEHGALRAMRSLGVNGLGEAMDRLGDRVFRIPPAGAVAGDIIGMECDGEVWDMALTVVAPNRRVFGIYDGAAKVIQPDLRHAVAAWRCIPCRR